jgi:PAS domain S-box-containing protein
MQSNQHTDMYAFLKGGGEMGRLTRSFDWAQTSLGTPDTWSPSLRTTLSIILNSRFPMFLFWGDQLTCFYNDAYRPSMGNDGKHPHALGRPGEAVWPETWPVIKPLIDQVLSGKGATWSEDQCIPICRNGKMEDVYWTFSYSPVIDETGKRAGVLTTCMETTEKVVNLKQLAENKDQLHFAIEAAELGTWDLNPHTNRFTGNDRLKEWFGLPSEAEIDLPLAISVIAENDRQRVTDTIRQVLTYESGGQYDVDYTIIHLKTGQERRVRAKGRAWFNDDNVAYRFNGTLQDITRQRETEEERQKLIAIMEASHEFIGMAATDTSIQYSNPAALAMLGWDTFTGKTIQDCVYPEDWPLAQKLLAELPEKGYFSQEIRFVNARTGNPFWLEWNAVTITDATSGEVTGLATVSLNITERKKIEQNLRESERRFRLLIEEAPVATCLFVGRELRVEVVNSAMIAHWGKGDFLLGRKITDILPELDGQPFLQILNNVFTSAQPYEQKAAAVALEVGGSLSTYYFDFTLKPLRDATGTVYAIMAMSVDVTGQVIDRNELKANEERYRDLSAELEQQVKERTGELETSNEELAASNEELVQANEELAETNRLFIQSNQNLEQFAFVASHDLQEPLRKIQSFGNLLQDQYGTQLGEGVDLLERIQSAANRMSVLIKDLLTFSRIANRKDTVELVFVRDVINTVLNDLDLVIIETNAQVIVESMPRLYGDASQLGQLFLNLLSNALKFRRPDTPPIVKIRHQKVSSLILPASIKPTHWAENYHRIDIADNGIGFDPKYVDRIFQVFQRLHGRQHYTGTGIGLAICEKVVVNHGGAITATSQPGKGSTFSVYLPV